MARSSFEESMSDSHKIGETRYRMSHVIPSGTIVRTFLLAGILLAVLFLASQSFFPAFAQEALTTSGEEEIDYDEKDDDPVVVYTATDPEGETVFWSVVDVDDDAASVDSDDFEIANGVLTFKDSPNFESPTDRAGTGDNLVTDNTYVVKVRASDVDGAGGNTHTITVTVNVQNVKEDGTVTFDRLQPKEGTVLTAKLEDDDGEPRNTETTPEPTNTDLTTVPNASTTWQWARSMSKSGPWTVITATTTVNMSTTTRTRTPETVDRGHYLRATAMYNDGQANEQTASGVTTHPVEMKEYINATPEFQDDEGNAITTANRSIDENSAAGTVVGPPVAAKDIGPDGVTQQVLTYTMTNNSGGNTDDSAPFTIDSSTGQIRVKVGATLDREAAADQDTDNMYEVTVKASDPSQVSSTIDVTIEVVNIDEDPKIADPVVGGDGLITSGHTARDVAENTAITTAISTYTATDPEDVANLSWSLSGADDDKFNITTTTSGTNSELTLTFAELPNYEARSNKVYRVKLTVTDSGGNTDSRDVAVTVTNEDEAGEISLTSHVQAEVGTTITASVSDLDGSVRGHSWRWFSSAPSPLSTSSSYRPQAADVGTINVTVTYTDGHGPNKTATPAEVSVPVQAREDPQRAPDFQGSDGTSTSTYWRSISEDEAANAIVGDPVTAADPGETLTYALSGTDAGSFAIGRTSGQITLGANTNLNYESKSRYSVRVTAKDPSGQTDSVTVIINVGDVPEPPEIVEDERGAAVTYPEMKNNRPNTDAVFDYHATDDEDDKARKALTWSFGGGTNDTLFNLSQSGVLSFKSPPNFEDTAAPSGNVYNVTLRVADSVPSTDTWAVTITVDNVDEDGTVTFNTLQPREGTQLTATLQDPDGEPRDTATTQAPVTTDLSTGTGDSATASTRWEWARSRSASGPWTVITATTTENMSVTSRSRTPEMADRGHYLRATAMYNDGQGEDKTASEVTTNAIVMEEYVNTAPMFDDDDPDTAGSQITMEVDEDESLEEGDAVGDPIKAKDIGPDGITQEVLQYSLGTGNDEALFTIDEATGQIKLGSDTVPILDYEHGTNTDRLYVVEITAEDPDELESTVSVTIMVMNVEEAPEFAEANADSNDTTNDNLTTVEVEENTGTTTVVSSYNATDDEDGATPVKWSLDGTDMEQFSLCNDETAACPDPADATVQLRFKEAPNFESPADSGANNVYNVTVVATDSKDMQTSREVTVEVTDVHEDGIVTLSNRHPEIDIPITASLTNPDDGTSGITWQWAYGSDCSSPTEIVNATSATYTPTGAAIVGQTLCATATYTDDAMGEDDSGTNNVDESKSDTATGASAGTVQAEDDNNTAPVLPDRAEREIAENSPSGTTVGAAVSATDDEDLVSGGPFLTYTMSGTDADSFEIASTTGQISVGEGTELDYETKKTYRVTVTATDPSSTSDSVSVTISVTNVDEPPTVSQRGLTVTGPASVSYAEDRTDSVVTYRAVGPDASGASWGLSGTDASAFSIPGGVLSFNSQPDHEAAADSDTDNMYNITVTATMGSFSDSQDVTVTVTNVDEPGTVALTYNQNQVRVGVEITAEEPVDPDGGVTGVTWQWESSSDGSTGWSDISGETSAAYTPVEGDVGNFLRATASYTDAEGSGKTASSDATPSAVVGVTATPNDGSVSVSPAQPVVGTAVTASLTDPDGNPVGAVSWQWAWSTGSSPTGTWTDISGETSASYTPVDGDVGRYLRATANYEDSVDGANQTASGITGAVQAATQPVHRYDANANGTIEREEVIEAINDFLFNDPPPGGGAPTTREEVIELITLHLFPS